MVEVFATNVHEEESASLIIRHLREHFPQGRISFDLTDCDHILCVESTSARHQEIIDLLASFGFSCEALV